MPLNPNIALSGRSVNAGPALRNFTDFFIKQKRQEKEDARQEKKDKRQERIDKQNEALIGSRIKMTNAQLKEIARKVEKEGKTDAATELAMDAYRAGQMLDAGDVQGTLLAAQERRQRVVERGGDPSHTDRFIELLQSDPKAASEMAKREVTLAEKLGFLERDPKSDVLSPAAVEQRIKLAEETARIKARFRAPPAADKTLVKVSDGKGGAKWVPRSEAAGQQAFIPVNPLADLTAVIAKDKAALTRLRVEEAERNAATALPAKGKLSTTPQVEVTPAVEQPVVEQPVSPVASPVAEQPSTIAAPPEVVNEVSKTLKDYALEGVGPAAKLKSAVSAVFGWMVDGSISPETTEAKQALNIFRQTAMAKFLNNPKAPVAEQDRVRKLFPDTDSAFTDPDDAVLAIQGLEDYLNGEIVRNLNTLQTADITAKERGDLFNAIAAKRELLSSIKSPLAGRPPEPVQTPPQGAIDKLRQNPELADFFDKKYGVGAAARILQDAGTQ